MNADNSLQNLDLCDAEKVSLAKPTDSAPLNHRPDSLQQQLLDSQIPEMKKLEIAQKFENDLEETRSLSSNSEDDNEEEQKQLAELLAKKRSALKTQRSSVSAEAYGQFNPRKIFVPRSIPKDQDTALKIKGLLLKSFIFQNIEEEELSIIIEAMEVRHYSSGSTVIRQGDDGNELYVVGSGELRCSKRFPGKTEDTYLRDYQSGEYFGELALLYNIPRAASITAITDSILYSLDRECFNHIVKDSVMKSRTAFEHFFAEIELFNSLDRQERSKLCDCLRIQTFDVGQRVINEGEKGDTFYMIIDGEAVAVKSNPKSGKEELVFEYSPKMYFGELALMRDVPRAASVVAKVE